MKKLWIILSIILISVVICGAVIFFVKMYTHGDTVYATKIECKYDEFNIKVGTKFKLNQTEFSILPANCTESIFYTSTDNEIASVDLSTGKIEAKKVGTCKIKVQIKSSKTENLETQVTLNVVADEETEDKVYCTINKSCSLSQQITFVDFEIDGNRSDITWSIFSGQDCIDQTNTYTEYDRIIISLKAEGSAVIIIDSPKRQTKIYLTITE